MKKVLVIEDNSDNLKLITYALKRHNYEVVSTETGEEGIEMALEMKPFFIIMDIDLPGISGEEATRKIRASIRGQSIPIIVITSYAMAGDRERICSIGCNGYFEKPIDPLTIMDEIHKIIENKADK